MVNSGIIAVFSISMVSLVIHPLIKFIVEREYCPLLVVVKDAEKFSKELGPFYDIILPSIIFEVTVALVFIQFKVSKETSIMGLVKSAWIYTESVEKHPF